MTSDFKWDGQFWTDSITLPFQSESVQIRIYAENDSIKPTQRQREVCKLISTYLRGIKTQLDEHAATYCRAVDAAVDLAQENVSIDYDAISAHWTVSCVVIGKLENCKGNYFFLSCGCDWELEHGMEFLLDGREIIFCSGHTIAFLAADTDDSYHSFGS